MVPVGIVNRWVSTRQLKITSAALRRAEAELRVEREQGLSYTDDAADAHGASLGGTAAEVLFAGKQGGLAGVDQVNLRIPRSLLGRGDVDVVLTVDGVVANTVRINLK